MIFTWNLDQQLNMTTETKHRQKNLKMTSFWQILTSLLFFRFMPDLEPSKSRIQDAQFVKLTFLLTVTFYFAKTQSRTKKYGSLNIALSKGTVFAKKRCFLEKMLTSAKSRGLGTKRHISWDYICVCIYVPDFKFLA